MAKMPAWMQVKLAREVRAKIATTITLPQSSPKLPSVSRKSGDLTWNGQRLLTYTFPHAGLITWPSISPKIDSGDAEAIEIDNVILGGDGPDSIHNVYSPVARRVLLSAHRGDFVDQLGCLPKARDLILEGHSILVPWPTGTGKTYFMAALIHELALAAPEKFGDQYPRLIVTQPAVVTQTQRVLVKDFGLKKSIIVTNYEQLRSTLGGMFLRWETQIENNEPKLIPIWESVPSLIISDECQKLKNETSLNAQIFLRASRVQVPIIFFSATPYSRPSHTRVVAVNLRPKVSFGPYHDTTLSNALYPAWVASHCPNGNAYDWSPKAMASIRKDLDPYTVRLPSVKYKNGVKVHMTFTHFATNEEATIYADAYAEYLEKLDALGKPHPGAQMEFLVALGQLIKKSSLIRAPHMGRFAVETYKKFPGKSIILSFSYSESIDACKETLIQNGIAPENIVELSGRITGKARQKQIDLYQSDKAHFLLLMTGAGGAGLSLDHNRFNKRPRIMIAPALWNAEQFLQVIGRPHRVLTESTTHIFVVWYHGTAEERMMKKMKYKLRSLKEVIKGGDTSFIDGITEKEAKTFSRAVLDSTATGGDEDENTEVEATMTVADEDAPMPTIDVESESEENE